MKKTFTTTACMLMMVCFAFSQSWSLNGNAGTTNSNFLGTTDNKKLTIKTNNQERMRITSGGNVGIGTNSPAELLHILGNQMLDGDLTMASTLGKGDINFTTEQQNIAFADPTTLTPSAMIYMFGSGGTSNNDRMVLAHSNSLGDWGLEYQDIGDEFHFRTTIENTLTIELGGQVGIGHSEPTFELHMSDNSAAKPTSSLWTVSSDERLKTNIADFTDGLNVITQIRPVWFNYNGTADLPTNERGVGTIAQEIQKVAPYMVRDYPYENERTGEITNYLAIDYNAMLFMFVNAFKEQQAMIDELKTEIATLKSENLGNAKASSISSPAFLGQSYPNPNSGSATIHYVIPDNANGVLKIYDTNGKLMQIINLSEAGSINVQTAGYAAGSYQYTLEIDGKTVDTKTMVIAK